MCRAIQFSAFFTILFEKVQPGDHASSEMSVPFLPAPMYRGESQESGDSEIPPTVKL